MKRRLLGAFGLLFVTACGDSMPAPSTTPTVDVSGNWSGTICSTSGGTGVSCAVAFQLSQVGNAVRGTFAQPAGSGSGTVTGSVLGSQLTLEHFPYTTLMFIPTIARVSAIVVGSLMTGAIEFNAVAVQPDLNPKPTTLIGTRS